MPFEFWKSTAKNRRYQGGGVLNTPPPPPATNRGSQEPATNGVKSLRLSNVKDFEKVNPHLALSTLFRGVDGRSKPTCVVTSPTAYHETELALVTPNME